MATVGLLFNVGSGLALALLAIAPPASIQIDPPSGTLSIASVAGDLAPMIGVPVRVESFIQGSSLDFATDGLGQTPQFPVLPGDQFQVTLGEASQLDGIAMGMHRSITLGDVGVVESGVQVLSQPLALPTSIEAYLTTQHTQYSAQYPYWTISTPPGTLRLRAFIAPLFHAGEVADALSYHGVSTQQPHSFGLAFKVGAPIALGMGGIDVGIFLRELAPAAGFIVDVFNIRNPSSVIAVNPACASAAFISDGEVRFSLLGTLQPGWCIVAVRPADSGPQQCLSVLSEAPSIHPSLPFTYQDPAAICKDCEPEPPVPPAAVCAPDDPSIEGLCDGWAWTSDEPHGEQGGNLLIGCEHRYFKVGSTKCVQPPGGSASWSEQLALKVTVTTSVKISGGISSIQASAGAEVAVTFTGTLAQTLGLGAFECGQCASMWWHLNLCHRTWTGHVGATCTKDAFGIEACASSVFFTTQTCSRIIGGHSSEPH